MLEEIIRGVVERVLHAGSWSCGIAHNSAVNLSHFKISIYRHGLNVFACSGSERHTHSRRSQLLGTHFHKNSVGRSSSRT